jgi:hypothetical protein
VRVPADSLRTRAAGANGLWADGGNRRSERETLTASPRETAPSEQRYPGIAQTYSVPVYATPGSSPFARPVPPSASTAKTLILIGLILQGIFVALFLLIGLAALAFAPFTFGLSSILLAFALVGAAILFLAYEFTYKRVAEGNYAGARTPTLVWGILSLLFLGIISGILYIVAYAKLGDAIGEAQAPLSYAYGTPAYATFTGYPAPAGALPAPALNPPFSPAGALCPRCGRPATFIPPYSRYYCYGCQQYV